MSSAISHDHPGLAGRGDVDQPALVGDGALALRLGLGHGGEDLARLGDLGLGRGEDRVGERDLARVDRPLADHAEGRGAAGLGGEAVGVGEVAEGAVDRQHAVGAAGGDDRGGDAVPGVAVERRARRLAVLRRQHVVAVLGAADAGGLHPHRGGEVGGAEAHRLQPRRAGGDLADVGEARARSR